MYCKWAVYNVFVTLWFKWIVDIFAQSQITSGVLRLSFFANNLHGELEIAQIRATLVYYAQIDAML